MVNLMEDNEQNRILAADTVEYLNNNVGGLGITFDFSNGGLGKIWISIIGTVADLPKSVYSNLPYDLPLDAEVLVGAPEDEKDVIILAFRSDEVDSVFHGFLGISPDSVESERGEYSWAYVVENLDGDGVEKLFNLYDEHKDLPQFRVAQA